MPTSVASPDHSLRVHRWHSDYLVPSTHPDPVAVRDRLDRAMRQLTNVLSRQLPALLDDEDSVICIRQLPLDLAIDMAETDDVLAKRCAQAVIAALQSRIDQVDDSNIVRFHDRAAQLACFVVDVATGDAWGRWYHTGFDGLRLLSASAAIRTVLAEQPEIGLLALQSLSASDHEQVAAVLTDADASRLLDALTVSHTGDAESALRAVLDVCHGTPLRISDSVPRLALRLFVTAAEHLAAGAHLHSAAFTVARHVLRTPQPGGITSTRLRQILQVGRRDADSTVHHGESERPPSEGTHPEPGQILHTPFGGGFVLMDVLDALALDALSTEWPGCEDTSAASLLRLLLLAHAHGAARAPAFIDDPLWRTLLGIDPRADHTAVTHWLRELGPRRYRSLHALLSNYQAVQPDGAPQLIACTVRRRRHLLLLDDKAWLALTSAPRKSTRIPPTLREIICKLPAGTALRVPSAYADAMTALAPKLRFISGACIDGDTHATDIDCLLPQRALLPTSWQYLFAVGAHRLLRGLASRIPGFAQSHPAYLHSHFLSMSATLEVESDRQCVRLSRPPLALMLNLAGLNRGTRDLPWIAGPPLVLFHEE